MEKKGKCRNRNSFKIFRNQKQNLVSVVLKTKDPKRIAVFFFCGTHSCPVLRFREVLRKINIMTLDRKIAQRARFLNKTEK